MEQDEVMRIMAESEYRKAVDIRDVASNLHQIARTLVQHIETNCLDLPVSVSLGGATVKVAHAVDTVEVRINMVVRR